MKEKKSMKRVISAFIVLLLVGVLLLNNISSQPVLTVNVSGATSMEMCVQYNYNISIQNPSATETATNVVAVATIPAGFAIIDAGGGSVVGQQITWNIGTLDPLASWNTTITLEVTCTAVSGQILVNVTHDGGSSSGSIYLSVQPGAVTITKTPHVIQASVGDTVTWTITVKSTGLGPIRNVVVQDILGAGLIYISSSPPGNNVGQTTTWNSTHIPALALMNPGATVTITIDARVDACSNLENDAQVSWGCNGTPCETETTQASVQLIPHLPDISYTLPNFTLNYCTSGDQFTIPITNSGTGTAFDFELYVDFGPLSVVSVTSPAGAYYDTDHFYVGDILSLETVNLIFTLQVSNWCQRPLPSGSLLFRPQYEDECSNVFYPPVKLGSYSVQNGTSLTVSKTGGLVEMYLGELITYNISVNFSGTISCGGGSASSITVVDTIPNGFTVTNNGGGSVVGNTITWEYDIIPNVGSTTVILEYDAMIPPEGGTFTNTSTVIDYSSLPGDNPHERHYGPVEDQWTVEAPGTDILKLTLNTTINIPSPGGIVYFELTITNTGAMALDPVKLIDIIPDGLTYIPGSSWVDSPLFPGANYEPESIVDNLDGTQTLTWSNIWLLQPLPDMEPGDIVTVTFQTIVDPDRVGTFINKAIVIGTSVIGDVTDEDDSPIGVKAPAIKIVKSVDPSVTYQDGIVEFTMVVTNTGEVPLDPVEVVDVLPIGLTYADEADPVPDSVIVNPDDTTTIIWNNVGHLDVGESTKLEFKAIFNGEETRSVNVVTAKGTPPNGYPVYDDDDASVTAIVPPHIWKVLSYNGLYRCELCDMDDLFREAREMNIEFSEDLDRCCEPYDLIEALQEEIEKRGLETDPRYEQALELIEYAKQCCDDAFETYSNDKYIESYRWSIKRCKTLREAIGLMIEIFSPGGNKGCGCSTP